MTKFSNIIKSAALLAICTMGLTACETQEKDLATSFQVLKSFMARDPSGNPLSIPAGNYAGKFYVELVTDSDQTGFILQNTDNSNFVIPFAVPKGFSIGSGDVPATSTQQNIGIKQSTSNVQFVDPSANKTTVTESCSIDSSEHVCDTDRSGHQSCFDRTISRSGQRSVEVSTSGYTQDVEIQLLDSTGGVIANIALHQDETFENRNQGPCQ